MGVKETLILLGIVSSTCATIISQQCWYDVYVLHQAEAVPKLGTSCLCPPLQGYEVSQAIKKTNSDLERVVVFFYRDKSNNDIYMFTPNNDKQFSIPELPFVKDDELYKVNSDFSLRPFESSKITIKVDTQKENPSTHHYPHQKIPKAQEELLKIDDTGNVWYDQKNGPQISIIDYPHFNDQKIEKFVGQGQSDYPNFYDYNNLNGPKIEQPFDNSYKDRHEHKKEQNGKAPNLWYDQKNRPHLVSVDYPNMNNQKIDNSYNLWQGHEQGQNLVAIDYLNFYDYKNVNDPKVQRLVDNSSKGFHEHKKKQNVEEPSVWYDQKNELNLVSVDYPYLNDQNLEKFVGQGQSDYPNFYDYKNVNAPKVELLVDSPYKGYNKEQNEAPNNWYGQKIGPHIVTVDYPHLNNQKKDNSLNPVHYHEQEQIVGTIDYPNLYTVETSVNSHNDLHYDNVATIDYPSFYDHKQEKNVLMIDYPHMHEHRINPNARAAGKSRNAWQDYQNLNDQEKEDSVEISENSHNVWNDEYVVTTDITNLDEHKNEQILETNVSQLTLVPENLEHDHKLEVVLNTSETYDEWAKQVPNTDFKSWYSRQATHLPELNSKDPQHISIDDLQSHLVNLLKRYGYGLANNQILNANGEPLNLSNYRLIRVIIRAPDDEQHLTSNVIGVMLVNMSPLTILGVIPLRNTFDETNIQSRDDGENVLGPYEFISQNVNVLSNKNMTLENEADRNENSMNNLFTKLGNVLGHIVPTSKTLETRRDSGEDVLPGFRIIGGNPATGSGTPIASKGRSASP